MRQNSTLRKLAGVIVVCALGISSLGPAVTAEDNALNAKSGVERSMEGSRPGSQEAQGQNSEPLDQDQNTGSVKVKLQGLIASARKNGTAPIEIDRDEIITEGCKKQAKKIRSKGLVFWGLTVAGAIIGGGPMGGLAGVIVGSVIENKLDQDDYDAAYAQCLREFQK